MGTGYKGNTTFFRSIGQNIMIAEKAYNFSNGYFGINSIHGKDRTRIIVSSNALSTAKDFYDKIALGGKEQVINNNMKITRMADGTVITMRKVSHSDGTPAVDINVKSSSHTGGIKGQKIHFIQEGQ